MPTTETVVIAASGGDYTSLFSAEAGEQRNLVTSDEQLDIQCEAFQDTTPVDFAGWTTDSTRYIRVFAAQSHGGAWSTSSYRLVTTSGIISNGSLALGAKNVIVEGIQIHRNYATLYHGCIGAYFAPSGSSITIKNCILRGTGAETVQSRGIVAPANGGLYFYNNIIYDIAGSSSAAIVTLGTCYLYNNTIHNCTKGLEVFSGTSTVAKNNLIRSCTTAASGTFAAGTDYNATDNASMGYTVTGSGNTHDRVGAFFTFTDESGDDFSLAAADGGAKRYGVDLSGDANLPFSTDITGATRSGTWDIGAHQHVSSAATGTKFVRYIENLTAVTTTATALKSRIQLTLAADDQAASTDYLIIGYAEVANATAGAKVDLHLVNVTDSVTYQDLEPAPALSTNGDNITQTMYGVYTSAATPIEKNFEIRFAAVSGTAQIKNAHITVIKLESADKYDESTAKVDSTTSYADAASVTFTPASQGFYWIFGATEALHSAGHLPRAQLTVGGTQQTAIEEVDTPSASARTALALSWVEELAASAQTIALGVRDAGGSTDFYNTRVFAIRLDGFPDYWYAEETANDTTPSTSFEAKAAITQSFPAVRHLAIANIPARSSGTASINIITSLRDDSTVKREGITRSRQSFATEGTDSMSLAYSFTGSGSSKTIDAGWHFNSSASGNLPRASLLVMQLETSGAILAAGGYALAAGAGIGSTLRLGAGRGSAQSGAQTMAAVAAARVASGSGISASAAVGGAGTRHAAQAWPNGSSFANGQPALSAAMLSSGLTLASSLAIGQLVGSLGSNGVAAGGAVDAAGPVAQRATLGVARATADAHARSTASLRGSAFPTGQSAADGAAALVAELVGASGWALAQSYAFAGGLLSLASSGAIMVTAGAAGRPFTLRLGTCYLPAASSAAGSPSIPSAIVGAAGWALADSTAFVGPSLSRASRGHAPGQSAATAAPLAIRLAHAQVSSASSAQGRSRTVLTGHWEATSGSSASGEPSILGSLISSGFALGNSFAIGENAIVTITIAPTLPTPAAHQISKRVLDAMRARLIVAWEAAVRDAADGYAVPAADVERLATIDWTGLQRKQVWIGQVDPSTIGGATATVFPAASIAVTGTQHTGIEKFREWSGDVTAQIAIALTWRRASAVPDFDEQADLAEDAMYSTLHDRAWLSAAGHGMTFANSIEARGPIEQTGQHWLQVMLFQFTFEVDV